MLFFVPCSSWPFSSDKIVDDPGNENKQTHFVLEKSTTFEFEHFCYEVKLSPLILN